MLLSIIIPGYNYAEFLRNALDSILQQQEHAPPLRSPRSDFEVIVIDDGSTDHTSAVIREFQPLFSQSLRFFTQNNCGPGAARNKGIQEARGDFILFLDADDRLTPMAISTFRQALQKNPLTELMIAGHNNQKVRGKVEFIPAGRLGRSALGNVRNYFRKKIMLCNGAVFIAKKHLQSIRFPEQLKICEDIPFFSHILALAQHATIISTAVVTVHKHSVSRRHDIDALMAGIDHLPDLVFDPKFLSDQFTHLKNEFTGWMSMRVFRALYRDYRYREARQYYYRAIKSYPAAIFWGNYLQKFLRSWIPGIRVSFFR